MEHEGVTIQTQCQSPAGARTWGKPDDRWLAPVTAYPWSSSATAQPVHPLYWCKDTIGEDPTDDATLAGDPEILECAAELQRCIRTIMSERLFQDPQAYKALAARAKTLWHRLGERSINGGVYTHWSLQQVLHPAFMHGQNPAGVSRQIRCILPGA